MLLFENFWTIIISTYSFKIKNKPLFTYEVDNNCFSPNVYDF